jgi:protein required for attachment to host cells
MIELATLSAVVMFDGKILEIFEQDGDHQRFHINFINLIELEADRRDRHRLRVAIGSENRPYTVIVDETQVEIARTLVDAVRAAR